MAFFSSEQLRAMSDRIEAAGDFANPKLVDNFAEAAAERLSPALQNIDTKKVMIKGVGGVDIHADLIDRIPGDTSLAKPGFVDNKTGLFHGLQSAFKKFRIDDSFALFTGDKAQVAIDRFLARGGRGLFGIADPALSIAQDLFEIQSPGPLFGTPNIPPEVFREVFGTEPEA